MADPTTPQTPTAATGAPAPAATSPAAPVATKYQPEFDQYMKMIGTWEDGRNNKALAQNNATGNLIYKDADGTMTEKHGYILGDTYMGQKLTSSAQLLAITDEGAAQNCHKSFFEKPGIDKMPAEIQHQLFDISINGGPARATSLLKTVLHADENASADTLAVAANKHLADVGMAQFNNEIAAARIDFYDDLIARKPEKAVNRNGWHRRAAGFAMDKSPEEYAKAGFKLDEKGHATLPDQVTGADGKPAVKLPDGSTQPYDKWYWNNVVVNGTNDHATFEETKHKFQKLNGIGGKQRSAVSADGGGEVDGEAVPPVPMNEWAPQDRALFNLILGVLNALFGGALDPQSHGPQFSEPREPGSHITQNNPAAANTGYAYAHADQNDIDLPSFPGGAGGRGPMMRA